MTSVVADVVEAQAGPAARQQINELIERRRLNTGMRLGELRALQWTQVDLRSRVVKVTESAWEASANDQRVVAPRAGGILRCR